MSRKPYGLDHPTWDQPTCFTHDTAEQAWRSIVAVYGPNSDHTVVGPIPCPDCDGARRTIQGWTDKNGYPEDQYGPCATCSGGPR